MKKVPGGPLLGSDRDCRRTASPKFVCEQLSTERHERGVLSLGASLTEPSRCPLMGDPVVEGSCRGLRGFPEIRHLVLPVCRSLAGERVSGMRPWAASANARSGHSDSARMQLRRRRLSRQGRGNGLQIEGIPDLAIAPRGHTTYEAPSTSLRNKTRAQCSAHAAGSAADPRFTPTRARLQGGYAMVDKPPAPASSIPAGDRKRRAP